MAKATLINSAGQKQVVESGSSQAQQLFGQGYKLMTAPSPVIPQGATKITGPSGLQGLTESQLFRSGQDIYKLPEVPKVVSSTAFSEPTSTITPVDTTPDVSGLMAGVETSNKGIQSQLEAQAKALASQEKKSAIDTQMEQLVSSSKTANRDLQEQKLEQFGASQNLAQVQALMPQIARLEADFNKIAEENLNRPISSRIIGGTQDKIQRQKAVELAGLSAVAQAYQGNVDMARTMAQDAVNAQYKDQENYFNALKTQLGSIENDLSREEKVKADQLNTVIAERERLLEEEKNNKTAIQNIALDLAQAGADSSVVSQIIKASSPSKAIELASASGIFQKSNTSWTKVGSTSDGQDLFYDDISRTFKTADQLTINQLGNQVGTIKGLPSYDTRTANPGMTRSDRNNNPGNIKVSDYTKEFSGVVGVESAEAQDGGNFLIFESPEAGLNAIGRLLLEGKSYQGVNAETAIKKYNGNGGYGAANVGLDPNKDFQSQIQDPAKRLEVARAVAIAEGWSGGAYGIIQNEEAKSWADLINKGQAKIDNVPTKMRDAVANELSGMVSTAKQLTDTVAKEKADMALDLINHRGLDSAVGTVGLGRVPALWNIGAKQEFIASVEQLVSGLSLESLIEAKSRGATFGALSDTEMRILASSASKIGSYAIRDKNGKVTGYRASEGAFKDELRKVSETLKRGIETADPLDLGINNSTNPLGI